MVSIYFEALKIMKTVDYGGKTKISYSPMDIYHYRSYQRHDDSN